MRAIKAVVIGMAVLIVVALVAVGWAIFNLKTPADNRATADRSEIVSLGLPAACAIAGMEFSGERLAVRTSGPAGADGCERIYIVDLASGRVIATVAR